VRPAEVANTGMTVSGRSSGYRHALSPAARAEALASFASTELDVLVVGGGVVGAGAAMDAATRGLRTAIVEARDWASGTSSRSSKLIHGGLRYLEMFDFGLVREALHERSLLLNRLAPHLVHPVPFLYPLTHRYWERPYVGAGVMIYDALAATAREPQRLPRHKHLTRRAALRQTPSLHPAVLAGAVQYWDAQVDDARFTATLVRTAVSYGALAASRCQATEFLRSGDAVIGARLLDTETGLTVEVRARQVINATGVWTGELPAMTSEASGLRVRASKGVHLVVPRERLRSATGIITRTERSVLFVIPWRQHWIIGTTDTDWDLGKDNPSASARDIDYLLDHVNAILRKPLRREDVVGVYAGLRPLVDGPVAPRPVAGGSVAGGPVVGSPVVGSTGSTTTKTTKLSREHTISRAAPGLVVVAGGKFTTYRVMAAQAVDEAASGLYRTVPPSCTDRVPLAGASGYLALWNRRKEMAAEHGLALARLEHLLNRYGDTVDQVLELLEADPALGEPLPGTQDYLRAEAVHAVTHEGARHLDDVLARRTRLSIEASDRGMAAAPVVAELIAPPLRWSEEDTARELRHYQASVTAELRSEAEPDDQAAEAAQAAQAAEAA
jgi:glycerol-3-phosphate dehydrogenase